MSQLSIRMLIKAFPAFRSFSGEFYLPIKVIYYKACYLVMNDNVPVSGSSSGFEVRVVLRQGLDDLRCDNRGGSRF